MDCGSCKYQEALKLQERTQCHAQKIQHKHMLNLCSDALNKDVTCGLSLLWNQILALIYNLLFPQCGRCGGLVVSTLDSGLRGPGSTPGRGIVLCS